MIQFPVGFDVTAFASEIFSFAAPFVGVFFIIVCFAVVIRVLNRAS